MQYEVRTSDSNLDSYSDVAGIHDERDQQCPAFDSKAVLVVIALRLDMPFGCSSGAKKLLQSLNSGLERLATVGVRHCRLAS